MPAYTPNTCSPRALVPRPVASVREHLVTVRRVSAYRNNRRVGVGLRSGASASGQARSLCSTNVAPTYPQLFSLLSHNALSVVDSLGWAIADWARVHEQEVQFAGVVSVVDEGETWCEGLKIVLLCLGNSPRDVVSHEGDTSLVTKRQRADGDGR